MVVFTPAPFRSTEMFPVYPEGGNVNLAQQQQMRSGEYASFTLPSGSVFTALPPSPSQQQQLPSQQCSFMNGSSVLIDPPTTFFVQAQQQPTSPQQQQKMQTLLSYPHSSQGNSVPAGMSPFSNTHASSIPFYATASLDTSSFASAPTIASSNPATHTQRMGSAINIVPQQQQQQRMQPIFLQTAAPAAPANSPLTAPPYSPQQQRGHSVSANSAQYSTLSHHSQPQVLSPTPPSSMHGQFTGTPQLFATQPLSPLSSSSGGAPPSHTAAVAHPNASSISSVAYPTPPSSITQRPKKLVTETAAGIKDVLNSLPAAAGATTTTAASTHRSSSSSTATAAAAAAAPVVGSGVVDAEEMRQANERPFRFKMLPPPPTFDRFLLQWEANAADAHCRPWRRADNTTTCSNPHGDGPGRVAMLTEEDVLQRSASSATAGNGSNPAGATACTAEERLALAEQYHRILERWWYYMSVFEQKSEVRQRLGNLYTCPDFADAQRAVAIGSAELLPGEVREHLTPDEIALRTWSHLVSKWWEETKRRRRTRRSRRGSRKDASSSSAADRSILNDSQVMEGNATPPPIENDEDTSATSGNSFVVPSTEGSRLTRSLPENEGHLNFDFTNQTVFDSPGREQLRWFCRQNSEEGEPW